MKEIDITDMEADWEDNLDEIFSKGMGMTKEDYKAWMDDETPEEVKEQIRQKYFKE